MSLPTHLTVHILWQHSNDRFSTGENIAASTLMGSSFDGGYQSLAQAWADELQYWSPPNNCQTGQVCGHYTQLVWNATTLVGCGYTQCTTLTGVPWTEPSLYLVCDYAEAGNVVGENPYVAPPAPPSKTTSASSPSLLSAVSIASVVLILSLWLLALKTD